MDNSEAVEEVKQFIGDEAYRYEQEGFTKRYNDLMKYLVKKYYNIKEEN